MERNTLTRIPAIFLFGIALVTALLTACGGSSSSDTSSAATTPTTIAVSGSTTSGAGATINVATKDFGFALDTAQVPAGHITFIVTNNGSSAHDFRIKGNGVEQTTAMIHKGKSIVDPFVKTLE